jgi:hypothetical protein
VFVMNENLHLQLCSLLKHRKKRLLQNECKAVNTPWLSCNPLPERHVADFVCYKRTIFVRR